jgi:hypothetical protein
LITDRSNPLELDEPRTVAQIVGTALRLYARYPVVFVLLALAVVAPYELVVLALTGTAPLGGKRPTAGTVVTLFLFDVALVGPLISALHVHAVVTIGQREKPRLFSVVARGARVLPVVAAAEIVAGIGIGLGLFAFVVPGIYLLIRWVVVAQVAAIEGTDWLGALRRSLELTRDNSMHVFAVLVLTTAVNLGVSEVGVAIAGTSTRAPEVVIGIAIVTLTRSFAALTTAILFFDLLARKATARR